jgi:hypothetical protein
MTTTKFTKAQQSAIDAAIAEQTKLRAEHDAANEPASGAAFFESLFSTVDGFALPSGKRVIISLVAGVVLAGVAGFLGAQLVTMMTVYAATLTTSAFLLFMIQFVGYALALIGATFIGGKLQAAILDGGIDRGFNKAKSYVGGLFGSATKTVAS